MCARRRRSSLSATSARRRRASTRERPPSCATDSISAPVQHLGCPRPRTTSLEELARPPAPPAASSRSAASTTVTRTPKRANTWASSHADRRRRRSRPARPGSSVSCTASRLVQYGVSASPSIGGAAGRVPVLSTTPRARRRTSWPADRRPGPAARRARPRPRTNGRPASSSRFDRDRVVPVVGGLVADAARDRRPSTGSTRRSTGQRVDPAGLGERVGRRGSSSSTGRSRSRGTRRRPGARRRRRPRARPSPAPSASVSPPGPEPDDDEVHLVDGRSWAPTCPMAGRRDAPRRWLSPGAALSRSTCAQHAVDERRRVVGRQVAHQVRPPR